jgi:hypothetical protein
MPRPALVLVVALVGASVLLPPAGVRADEEEAASPQPAPQPRAPAAPGAPSRPRERLVGFDAMRGRLTRPATPTESAAPASGAVVDLVDIEVRLLRAPEAISTALLGDAVDVSPTEEQRRALEAAIEGGEVESMQAVRVGAFSGRSANVSVHDVVSYVRDLELVSTSSGTIGDPVIGTIEEGLTVDVRPVVAPDGSILLDLEVEILDVSLVRHETNVEGASVAVQLPQAVYSGVRKHASLKDGEMRVLAAGATPDGGGRLLVTLRGRRAGQGTIPPPEAPADGGEGAVGAPRGVEHTVLLALKDPSDAPALIRDVRALVAALPVVRDLRVGVPLPSERPEMIGGFHVAAIMGFASREDLDRYVKHADHVALVAKWRDRIASVRFLDVVTE